jgi:hypothetical protein
MSRQSPTSATDGWIRFASLALIIVGGLSIIDGLISFIHDGYFIVRKSELLIVGSYKAWGTAHLVLGILLVVSGLAVGAGMTWGRVVATIVAIFNIFAQFSFIPSAPVASFLIIAFDVAIIYALTVHVQSGQALAGPRMRDTYGKGPM